MALSPPALYCRDNSSFATWVGVGSVATGTLTISSTTSGAPAVGMALMNGSILAGIITGGSGTSWTTTAGTIAGGTTLWAFAALAPGSVGWSNVSPWQASHAYSAGTIVRQSMASCRFNGSITTNALTVNSVGSGTIVPGQLLLYAGGNLATTISSGSGTSWTTAGAANVTNAEMLAVFLSGNERVFICTTGGTSGAAEPTWVLTHGAKTTDNTAAWTEVTGAPMLNGDLTNTPAWQASQPATLGWVITDVARTNAFVCTTAGTTKTAPEPTWNTTAGATTADSTATWTSIGPVSNFTATWGAPGAHWTTLINNTWSSLPVQGVTNYVFLANDHAEQFLLAPNPTNFQGLPGQHVMSVSVDPATVPPTTSTWSAGAGIYVLNGALQILPSTGTVPVSCYGMTFYCGIAASASAFIIFQVAGNLSLDKCTLGRLCTGNGGSQAFQLGALSSSGSMVTLNDCTFRFGNVGDGVRLTGRGRVQNLSNPVHASGVTPTSFFSLSMGFVSETEVVNCDFSGLGGNSVVGGAGLVTLSGCKLGASTVVSTTATAIGPRVAGMNCDSAASNYLRFLYEFGGTVTTDTAVVRTGGAQIDLTPLSDKLVTVAANLHWLQPFVSLPSTIWNATTGSAVTVTVYGIANAAALPNNDEIWFEVEYPSSASSPLTAIATTAKANAMAASAAVASDTSAWDSKASARVNGATYALGNIIKVASNPTRLFFCTAITTGVAAGSEPAGYASAVDGGSVTDGGATFRAGVRFKLALTVTPQIKGPLITRIKAAKPSTTYYLDWLPVLT